MQEKEKIKVYVRIENQKTVCICLRAKRGCNRPCEQATVTRDRFEGWQSTMKRTRYG